MEKEIRMAVLIDADNISSKYIKYIFDEITNHGIPTYKRIYGDWTDSKMKSWKEVLLEYSIAPIQQYSYTTGKNSTDSALIIDAMDILYSNNVDGFCIVSSDSDFTKLASRLRESGQLVVGMGEKKTPRPFIVACERFKYLETLSIKLPETEEQGVGNQEVLENKDDLKDLTTAIKAIVSDVSDDDGWAYLAVVGNRLNKRYPDFDTRNYGFAKLTPLISFLGSFEMQSRKSNNSQITHKVIRNKIKKKSK